MIAALALPLAHLGHLVNALPFVAPCFLLVGGLLAMRAVEHARGTHNDSGDEDAPTNDEATTPS